eukprot:COSAG06_NODE_63539_length_262_cov_0.625767_1_plen_38_part_10
MRLGRRSVCEHLRTDSLVFNNLAYACPEPVLVNDRVSK